MVVLRKWEEGRGICLFELCSTFSPVAVSRPFLTELFCLLLRVRMQLCAVCLCACTRVRMQLRMCCVPVCVYTCEDAVTYVLCACVCVHV